MQWSAEKNAGFSQAEPWIEVQKNYKTINTEVEEKQSDSILNFYKIDSVKKKTAGYCKWNHLL